MHSSVIDGTITLDPLDLKELRPMAIRIAARMGIVGTDREDIAQETLAALWTCSEAGKLHAFEGKSDMQAVHALLATIAIRAAKHHRRKAKPDKMVFRGDVSDLAYSDPLPQYEAREAIRTIERLPRIGREAVGPHAIGFTMDEIAAMVGVRTQTVRTGIFRARDALAMMT